jgi:hypothetical protein
MLNVPIGTGAVGDVGIAAVVAAVFAACCVVFVFS